MVKKALSLIALLVMNFSMHGAAGHPQQLYIVTNEKENPKKDTIDAQLLANSITVQELLQDLPGAGSSDQNRLHLTSLSKSEWNLLKFYLKNPLRKPNSLEIGISVAKMANQLNIPALLDNSLASVAEFITQPEVLQAFLDTPGWTQELKIYPNLQKALIQKIGKLPKLAEWMPRTSIKQKEPVRSVAVTADGSKIVSGSDDRAIEVWDIGINKLLRTLRGHVGPVNTVAVTLDGSKVVSGSWDNTIKIWNMHTGQLLRTLAGGAGTVYSVAITPDGGKIVVGLWDNAIKIWDINTYQLSHILTGHTGPVYSVAITSDGRKIVSGSDDTTIKIWDMSTNQLFGLHTLMGNGGPVYSVAVTPDSSKVVSGSYDKTIKIWDINTDQLLHTLMGHEGSILSVAVTPDGSKVVSSSDDDTIKIWDVNTGQLLRTLTGHTGQVYSVAVTPDGRKIVAGTDKSIDIWRPINWSNLALDQALLIAACVLLPESIDLPHHLKDAYAGLNPELREALGVKLKQSFIEKFVRGFESELRPIR